MDDVLEGYLAFEDVTINARPLWRVFVPVRVRLSRDLEHRLSNRKTEETDCATQDTEADGGREVKRRGTDSGIR